ncbi:Calx-beta domain-containing protein, partial [Microcoleus sp. Pol14C6]|uniref:Calx-beta domain-containing protein n=1 Tax=unclassified Microcoleus TaxID=2642155 RepID=UPI002FCF3390
AASINYQTLDGSASSAGTAADYTSATGVLNFAAGQTTASFTVPALTDAISESAETVNLVLFGGNVSSPSILTINDVPPTGTTVTPTPTPTPVTSTATQFVFSAATFTTPESSGFATVTVNRIGSTTAAGTISYSTLDGSALSTGGTAADYASTAGVLTFGPGVTSTTFSIFVNPDTVPEMTESVNLYLNNGPVGTPSTARLDIIDGSSSASGNVFQYSASDYGSIGAQGGGTTVTVTRSSGLGAASIDYIILAGTPAGTGPAPVYGNDYLLNPGGPTGGTLSFANGQLSQTFTIQDNPFTTNNGIVRLGLANPTAGYSFGSTAATSITLI